MKTLRKKLFLSILAVAFAVVSLATSTFAWFAVNTRVTVSGMSVKTKVSSNLLIAGDELDSTAKLADENFGTAYVASIPAATLEPVSTIDGKKFFYTTKAKADGAKESGVYSVYNAAEVPTPAENTSFNTAYDSTGAVGYVDYVFQLKAINPDTNPAHIDLTMLSLEYDGVKNDNKAFRVAVFAENITSAAPAGGSAELKGIFTPNGATNQGGAKAVTAAEADPENALAAVTYNGMTKLGDVAGNTNGYYKVVVRLWLEGEDTTCTNSTFLPLTGNWSLKLAFSLDTDNTKSTVTEIALYRSKEISSEMFYTDETDVYKYTEDEGYKVYNSTNFDDFDNDKLTNAKSEFGIA